MARIRKLDSSQKTSLILGQEKLPPLNALGRPLVSHLLSFLKMDSVHLEKNMVSGPLVKKLSRYGVRVFVWTVNDPDDFKRLMRMGVDGIVTDKPDLLYETCLEMARCQRPLLNRVDGSPCKFAYAAQQATA